MGLQGLNSRGFSFGALDPYKGFGFRAERGLRAKLPIWEALSALDTSLLRSP